MCHTGYALGDVLKEIPARATYLANLRHDIILELKQLKEKQKRGKNNGTN
jgi:hypothetical protein